MKKIFLSSIVLSSLLLGVTIDGTGFGLEPDAKKLALDDLSHTISSVVASDYRSYIVTEGADYHKKVEQLITIKSELPILGAKYHYDKPAGMMIASLESDTALPLYLSKLTDLKNESNTLQKTTIIAKTSEEKYALYELMLSLSNAYQKYEIVALMLGYKRDEPLSLTQSELQSKMIALSQNITSIELASKIVAANFKEKNIFVYPPITNGSNEITPFANVFKDSLGASLNQASTPVSSQYSLIGNYEVSPDGIFLTYNLFDSSNNNIKSSSLFLKKEAYANLRATPNNLTFDQEIEQGKEKLTSTLKVDLSIKDFGSRNLLLKNKQDIQIIAKSNHQAYIYMVGYVLHDKEKFSYLVELQDGGNNERFVYTLGASDVNRPIMLPLHFEVSEPFGYESLQLFASTVYPLELPQCKMKEGYCVISGEPKEVVIKTRGLKAKKQEEQKAEATLSFTTVGK